MQHSWKICTPRPSQVCAHACVCRWDVGRRAIVDGRPRRPSVRHDGTWRPGREFPQQPAELARVQPECRIQDLCPRRRCLLACTLCFRCRCQRCCICCLCSCCFLILTLPELSGLCLHQTHTLGFAHARDGQPQLREFGSVRCGLQGGLPLQGPPPRFFCMCTCCLLLCRTRLARQPHALLRLCIISSVCPRTRHLIPHHEGPR